MQEPLYRIVWLGDFIPREGRDGTGTLVLDIVEYLVSRGVEVHFGLCRMDRAYPCRIYRLNQGRERLLRWHGVGMLTAGSLFISASVINWKKAAVAVFRKVIGVLGGGSSSCGMPAKSGHDYGEPNYDAVPATDKQFVCELLRRIEPAAVFVSYARNAALFGCVGNEDQCPRILVTHDVVYQRVADAIARFGVTKDLPMSQSVESRLLDRADVVVAVQATDAKTIKEMAPSKEVIVAPVSFPARVPGVPVPGRCLFVGSEAEQNVESIRWFIAAVWPKVRQRVAAAELHIVGSVGRHIRGGSEGVKVCGRVRDLERVYADAAVVVIPLIAGSGLKIKLIEAMGHGSAVVCTSVAIQGVEKNVENAVRVADSEEEFADAVVGLLQQEESRSALASRASNVVREQFSPEECYSELFEAIRRRIDSDSMG